MEVTAVILTLIVAAAGALIARKAGIAGGMLIGSMIFVAAYNISIGEAVVPSEIKILSQMITGAFIGMSMDREELKTLAGIVKPAITIVAGMFFINIILGFMVYLFTPFDLTTALIACVPGGVAEMTMAGAQMGADTSKVAAMHVIRLISVITVFPPIIRWFARGIRLQKDSNAHGRNITKKPFEREKVKEFLLTMTVAIISGIAGVLSNIPAGAIVFSLAGVTILQLVWGKGYVPVNVRRAAQVCNGAYVGYQIQRADFLELQNILLPVLILVLGFIILNTLLGFLVHRIFKIDIVSSLFSCTPAGASDMALIADEMGAQGSQVAVIQIVRVISTIVFFPTAIEIIVNLIISD